MKKFVLKNSETGFQKAETRFQNAGTCFQNAKTALSSIFFERNGMDSAQKKACKDYGIRIDDWDTKLGKNTVVLR